MKRTRYDTGNPGADIGFLVKESREDGTSYIRANAVAVLPDGRIRNMVGAPLADLVYECHVRPGVLASIYEPAYGDVYRVSAQRARTMAKILSQIERSFAAMSARYGPVREGDFATCVQRLATAVGATKLVFSPKEGSGRGWSYDDTAWHILDIPTGCGKIGDMLETARAVPVEA